MSVACVTSRGSACARANKRFRSTKGASKARRDQINGEIRSLRALLPVSAAERERLSYLHSMSVICAFIRKSVSLTGCSGPVSGVSSALCESFLEALSGFIVALTGDGKLMYVSENVSEYLGLSMVDVLQNDSFYDLIDSQDVETVKESLEHPNISTERSFVCGMLTSKALRVQDGGVCSVMVRGRFLGSGSSVFVALCSPTVNRLRDDEFFSDSTCFQTLHRLDMSFTDAPYSVLFHLGFSAEELIGQSWYRLMHPDDITLAAKGHARLIESEEEVQMVVRLQCKDQSWAHLHMRATADASRNRISCFNHLISDAEAAYLRLLFSSHSPKTLQLMDQQDDEPPAKARKTCCGTTQWPPQCPNEFFSTPPYSPTSLNPSHCSAHSSASPLSFHSPTSSLSSQSPTSSISSLSSNSPCSSPSFHSPTSSFSYQTPTPPATSSSPISSHFSYSDSFSSHSPTSFFFPHSRSSEGFPPQTLLSDEMVCSHSPPAFPVYSLTPHPFSSHPCPPDTHLVPIQEPGLDMSEATSDLLIHPEEVHHGTQEVQPDVVSSFRLSSMLERSSDYSESERVEISVLAHQICSLASSFHMYSSEEPRLGLSQLNHWLLDPCDPARPEPLLDERVIDSILRDLETIPVKPTDCAWPGLPTLY